jgi:tetratricopeptide (TPR) repeat protein
MSSALLLDAPTERIAVNLLRHLEWQHEGFSLLFLFADLGPSLQLADWLDQRLAMQGRPLQRQDAKDRFVRSPEVAVDELMAELSELSAQAGGVWYAVQRHPGDAQWNRARTMFLARLNERRFLLERDLKRPLVLVLPAAFRAATRAIAPDIWHKRDLSEELRSPTPGATPQFQVAVEPGWREVDQTGSLPAFIEWQRMASTSSGDLAYLPTAWRACEELLAAGRPADAEQVAEDALSLARRHAKETPNDATQRDLSVSLDYVGGVAQVQGDWTEAESVYRESLALRRQLVERLGGTPESLRDLSLSLDKVGGVAQAQGDWTQAESVYRESLALSRQLVERLGGTPESLDDLAVSLLNLAGRPGGDPAAGAEAAEIYRLLASRFPSTVRFVHQLQRLSAKLDGPVN